MATIGRQSNCSLLSSQAVGSSTSLHLDHGDKQQIRMFLKSNPDRRVMGRKLIQSTTKCIQNDRLHIYPKRIRSIFPEETHRNTLLIPAEPFFQSLTEAGWSCFHLSVVDSNLTSNGSKQKPKPSVFGMLHVKSLYLGRNNLR